MFNNMSILLLGPSYIHWKIQMKLKGSDIQMDLNLNPYFIIFELGFDKIYSFSPLDFSHLKW